MNSEKGRRQEVMLGKGAVLFQISEVKSEKQRGKEAVCGNGSSFSNRTESNQTRGQIFWS